MDNIVKVYWQPGCSSCLKTKEFLQQNKIDFKSINVLEDEEGLNDLKKFGLKMVPIVIKNDQWANGAVFRDVAKVVGFKYNEHRMLQPTIIKDKILQINDITSIFLEDIADDTLNIRLPGRPRTYMELVYHVFNIPEVFLNYIENNTPYTYEALLSDLPDIIVNKKDLLEYGKTIKERFSEWWVNYGVNLDFSSPADVYYGKVSYHEVLERTGWHTGQHCRQIDLLLKEKLKIKPKVFLNEKVFDGLPMPKNIWDNERSFDEDPYQGQFNESLNKLS